MKIICGVFRIYYVLFDRKIEFLNKQKIYLLYMYVAIKKKQMTA